jgi:hypothetical protein
MKILSVVLIGIIMTGCVSDKVNVPNYPAGIANICNQQLNNAKVAIEACGSPLRYQSPLTVGVKKGTRFINGMWCWELTPGYYIGGITYYGRNVVVGCNPNNENDVNSEVLYHEFGHYWLQSNYGISNHAAKYNPAFHWSGLDNVKSLISTNCIIVDTPENFKKFLTPTE